MEINILAVKGQTDSTRDWTLVIFLLFS